MGIFVHTLREALASLQREARRLLPMALGITWGMASVMVLLAVANGFESSQKRSLEAYGDRFILLRLNRAELDRSQSEERRLQMDTHDIERLRKGAPAALNLSPMNWAYRVRMTGTSGSLNNVFIAGVLPEITRIRNLPLAEGRFFNEVDNEDRRRVIVLGPVVRQQLFGNGPAVGRTVRMGGYSVSTVPSRPEPQPKHSQRGAVSSSSRSSSSSSSGSSRSSGASGSSGSSRSSGSSGSSGSSRSSNSPPSSFSSNRSPNSDSRSVQRMFDRDVGKSGETFEVIGVLEDLETSRESYVSVARLAFIPFETSLVVYDKDYSTMLLQPRSVEERDLVLKQFREVMGARYGFNPEDRNAVVIYFDAIERARSIKAIFGGVRIFLIALGVLILGVGAIGVMNVILVSVAARTFEIGLRKALGATPFAIYLQFFLETMIACLVSGIFGFAIGAAGIELLHGLPLPEGFSKPVLDAQTSVISFAILTAIAVVAGFYPARRASLLAPVEALQTRA